MSTAEAEKVLKHYHHHAIHILGQEIRIDRSTPPEAAFPPSPRLYFTGWEGDAPSLRAHFRALRSKIVDFYICKSISLSPVHPVVDNHPPTVRDSDPNGTTASGFVEFCDLETAKEVLARFNTPDLVLAYSRHRPRPRPATRELKTWAGPSFGLKKRGGRSD